MASRALKQARTGEARKAALEYATQALKDVKPQVLTPVEVPMDEDEERALVTYLDGELSGFFNEHSVFVDRLLELIELYRAPKATTEKNFPFKRASQVTIPLAKMTVNVIAPRVIDELVRADPLWSVRSSHKVQVLEKVANETEQFLRMYADRRINIENKIETLVMEGCKLGSGVWEVVMDTFRKQTARYTEDGTGIRMVSEEDSVGPNIRNVPLQDLIWTFGFTDPQEMPWIGKMVHLTSRQIVDRVHSGKFRKDGAARVLSTSSYTGMSRGTDRISAQHDEWEKTEATTFGPYLYDIAEIYVYWPIQVKDESTNRKKTVNADLLVYYHYDSRTVLGVRLNPWWHRKRPYLGWAYSPVEYRWLGEGIPEQVEQFQAEMTAMHRLRLDNQTLSGMRMIVISRMVEGLGPGEPLYPGKVIRAQNATDVQPFQLADVYPSTVLDENLSMRLVERVTGINEATLGQAMPVTRTTATAQVSLLEEQAKRLNLTIRRGRRMIGLAGEMVYDLFHQFGTGGLPNKWMGPERGAAVELLFSVPRDEVTLGFSIGVTATSPKVNKQLDMQANLQLFNLMVSAHQQILQLVMGLGPQFAQQALPLVAHALVSGARRFLSRVLRAFDESDPEGVLTALAVLERILPNPAQAFGGEQAYNQEMLREAVMALRPELAAEMQGAVQSGLTEAALLTRGAGGAGEPSQALQALAGSTSPLAG